MEYNKPNKIITEVKTLFVTGELGTYHVKIMGEGKVTILLECGMMHTLHQWQYLQKELSQYAKVIAYDRLGYGKSGKWTSERSAEQQAFECYDLLMTLNISSPLVVVGHSLGAYVTYQLNHLFPNRVQSMILLDPTHPQLEDNEQKLYDKLLYQYALLMKRANQLKITNILPSQLISKMFKQHTEERFEMLRALKSLKHWKTVVSEWKNLYYSNKGIGEALKKQIDIPLLVLTASKQSGLSFGKKNQAELLQRVEDYHQQYARMSLKGSHKTIQGYTHSSIYGNNKDTAKNISQLIRDQIDLFIK
ncbi:alpha/beta fold hydrolase [Gottfriedia solisilvae]|nr:alpha/beta hydrolase [Gottfriedia solisilvae]